MTFENNTCNNCGTDIIWRHPITKERAVHPKTKNSRPLNLDGTLHLCMYPGQPDYFEGGKKIDKPPGPPGYFYTTDG